MPREHAYYIYILSSLSGTLYIGITNDLIKRIWQHKHHRYDGFTAKYDIDRLMYSECFQYVDKAIAREKELEGWTRAKKIALFTRTNPSWKDLSRDWYRTEVRYTKPSTFSRE